FFRAQLARIPAITPVNLANRTVIITGANAGIGLETALEILKSQPKRVILAVRNIERGQAAASELRKGSSEPTEVDVRQVDQASLVSVKSFVDGLAGQEVDIAILNAAPLTDLFPRSMKFKFSTTTDGYESDLQVNALAPALLSFLLLSNLRRAAATRPSEDIKPHLCLVSNGLHEMAKFPERKLPAGQVLAALNDSNKYNNQNRYPTTNLISLLWTKELAKRAAGKGVVINAPNPGFTKSGLLRDAQVVVKYLAKGVWALLGRSPEDAARCILDATIVKGEESHGCYMCVAKISHEYELARGSEGEDLQARMWEEIIGVLKQQSVLSEDLISIE
ncbi:NAD(P)-binding protein, partial [Bimuria novae-zelandiae CBS 107.79]